MATQKALIIPERQGNWELREVPIPKPGPNEVLVKIMSTALNPVDWNIQVLGFYATNYPFISGVDAAGIIEEVGEQVMDRMKGDRIFFQGFFKNSYATFQQFCIVPAELTAKARIPGKYSFDQAASVPLGLGTVVTGMWNHHPEAAAADYPAPWEESGLSVAKGKPTLIIGGSSSVGQYAIQIAKLSGFSSIITTTSLRNEPLIKSLGGTHVLDRNLSSEATLAKLNQITGGRPIECIYDAISQAETQQLAYRALAPGGVLVIVLPDKIPAELKVEGDGKKVVMPFGLVHLPENRQVGVDTFKRLTEWLETGVLVPNNVEVLPNGLAGIPEGLKRMEEKKISAIKLIARPQETL